MCYNGNMIKGVIIIMENFNGQTNVNTNTVNQPYSQAYPPPLPPEIAEEKRFKKWMYKIFGGNLLYDGIMLAVVIGISIVISVIVMVVQIVMGKPESFYDDFMVRFENTDMGSTIAVIIACFFLALFMRKVIGFREIFTKRKSMNIKSFFIILSVFMGGQLVFTMLGDGFESLLNLIGFSAMEAIESASSGSESVSMMIYAGFAAPIFEEIVFRGFMMQSFEKTGVGKGYAILISSIMFGVMHGNFVQAPFAFAVGLVLGYTAMEYGIKWSILLHFLNNFVFGDVLLFILERLPENAAEIIETTIFIAFAVIAVILLIVKRKSVAAYVKENYKTPKKYYKWTLTNPLFIVFCVVYFAMSFTTITRIG